MCGVTSHTNSNLIYITKISNNINNNNNNNNKGSTYLIFKWRHYTKFILSKYLYTLNRRNILWHLADSSDIYTINVCVCVFVFTETITQFDGNECINNSNEEEEVDDEDEDGGRRKKKTVTI